MRVRTVLGLLLVATAIVVAIPCTPRRAIAANEGQPTDWQRFYYYPYVFYPHNFQRPVEFDHMYYRYPPQRQIPVYNTSWYNFYPEPNPWYKGHGMILDVF